MATQTGTATDHKDLLDRLQTFAVAQGWVVEASSTDPDPDIADTYYLRGPGSTDTENVHVNIQTYGDTFNNIFTWRIRGATGYDSLANFDAQPNVSPQVYLIMQGSSMDYWFYVSNRRICVVLQASTTFYSMYAGFFLPYALPTDYPYPLYIGASYDSDVTLSTVNSGIRAFADPGTDSNFVRDPSGIWGEVRNHGNNNGSSDDYEPANFGQDYTIWPYNTGGGASNDPQDVRNWSIRPAPGAPNALMLLPLQIASTQYQEPVLGMLEDAFFVPGFGMTSNDTFQLGTEVATGLLTLTANPTATETVTIGIDNAALAQLVVPGADVSDGDTVTIDGKTYTFQATLTNVDGNVHIGTDATDTLSNLVAAINLGAGSGTDYAAATTLHPTVSAVASGTERLTATAKSDGLAGNSIAVSTTSANAYWSNSTLSGGTEAIEYTFVASIGGTSPAYDVLIGADAGESRDNLVNAINQGPGAGTTYAAATKVNNWVRALANSTQNMDVFAREFGTNGNSIETTETLANGSFGGATLSGGGGNETYRVFQNGTRTGERHFYTILER